MPMGVKHPLAPEVMDHYREAMPTPKSRVGAAELPVQLMGATRWLGTLERDVKDRLANVPMLLVWGLLDPMFGRSFLERFRETFKLARVIRLDAKHFIQEDAPREISEAIETFLEEGLGARGSRG